MHQTVNLYFEEHGSGIPVILLHGYPLDHSIWNTVAELMKAEARVILPDLRGFGRSAGGGEVAEMRLMAQDIAALMDSLQIERAVLAGHSMGGYVSLNFAHAYPERLLGLALVASQAAADTPERRSARLEAAALLQQEGVAALAKEIPARLTCQPQWIEPLKALIQNTRLESIQAALRGMAQRPDASPWLPQINVPALVIAGARDVMIPVDQARQLARALPQAALVQLEDSAHMPMLEHPEAVAQALLGLVARATASG